VDQRTGAVTGRCCRGELEDITAITANDAWAVGSWRDTVDHPLAVHWDGTRWTNVPIDDSAAPGRYRLTAVDAIAPGDVWAAGSVTSADPGGSDTALVLHYTNGGWQDQRLGTTGVVAGTLHGIDMVSATEGWAVGEFDRAEVTLAHTSEQTDTLRVLAASDYLRRAAAAARLLELTRWHHALDVTVRLEPTMLDTILY
jgi:hypothetical protein